MKVGKFVGLLSVCVVGATMVVGGAGCSEAGAAADREVTARVSSRLTAGTVKSISGTYTDCTDRDGSWSVLVSGSAPLPNPALSVVMNDVGCQLAITEIVADESYSASPALGLSDQFADSPSTFTASGGANFKANAILSSASFSSDFDITIVHSDDPATEDGGTATGTYATVTTSTVNTLIPAPDYTFSLTSGTPLTVQMDAAKNVISVAGSATLSFHASQGTQYIIDRGTLSTGATLVDVTTAWATESLAGRVHSLTPNQNESIPAASFALTNLSSNVTRTVIVARTVAGVTAYQLFRVTFKGS